MADCTLAVRDDLAWLDAVRTADAVFNLCEGVGGVSRLEYPVASAVELAGGRTLVRQLCGIGGHAGKQLAFPLHFGLGPAERIEVLEVRWPDGGVERFPGPGMDQTVELHGLGPAFDPAPRALAFCDALSVIGAPFLELISFIVVIASTVQLVEMFIKKVSPALFRALGIFLPLITTNCAILGLAIFATNRGYGFWEGVVYALGAGLGFTLAMVLLAGLREESELSNVPALIKGTAMNLIIAGILSMAFMGFAGLFST